MLGSVMMIFGSVSRLGIFCLPLVFIFRYLLTNLFRPWIHFVISSISIFGGLIALNLIDILQTFQDRFTKARSGSSKVRAALQRMAFEYWKLNPIWGYGRLEEKGPAALGFKQIGSHHTWYGILYTHGIVGFVALF
ncbi:MAG: O-antigen ligase family protein [Calothrix sp. SM1_7_51]|nr:O-antigen ligase family protein [Calothrix sp. SM1_7_51]